jgi:predicted negative regulator of RcsB-dependent stress response
MWLVAAIAAILLIAGSALGYKAWTNHKAELAQQAEDAKLEADIAEFSRLLTQLNSLNAAMVSVQLANTEVFDPDSNTLH